MNEKNTQTKLFVEKLRIYREQIDIDIKSYSKTLKQTTLQDFGHNSRLATDVFLDLLSRGGKRIRGSLVMLAYEMSGGKDKEMIIEVARAIEIFHAYILIIDDIQDRSVIRRDNPTAHVILSDYHRKNELAANSEHFGLSIALNAALIGAHLANDILANLNLDEGLKNEVISLANKTMVATAHGQTNDILNEVVAEVSERDVMNVLEWKTARYTFLSPLQIGMVLAGEGKNIGMVEDYAYSAGIMFQITDDILGTFSSELKSGKSPVDDTREGKRTVITVYALKNANDADLNFVLNCLGNPNISPAEFERYKQILIDCGAVNYARKMAKDSLKKALDSLDQLKNIWPTEGIQFLEQLAMSLIDRET